jgi:protein-tyrosine kinase
LGSIFTALGKYRKERDAKVSGRLRNSDYELLLQFDENTGRLETDDASAIANSDRLKRLMTYRLIDASGRMTPAGQAKYEELRRAYKDRKPERTVASSRLKQQVPRATQVDKLSTSDWAILMKYDRKSGNLLTYDPETDRLDRNSRAILKEPALIQRLIDADMILPGGRLTPQAKRECARIEQKLKRKQLKGSAKREITVTLDKTAQPSETLSRADLDALLQTDPETHKLDLNNAAIANDPGIVRRLVSKKIISPVKKKAQEVYAKDISASPYKTPHDTPKPDKSLNIDDLQTRRDAEPAAGPHRSAVGDRFVLNRPTPGYDKNAIDKNLVSLFRPDSFEAEQFKILRTNLLFPTSGQSPRSIMVTSAVPGEGKSFVAANLAVSIALHINRRVLLIDCDLRRPSIQRQFGFGDTPGLSDYLSRGVELPSLLLKTGVDHLTILPAGRPPSNPSELLSSERMSDLIEEVSGRYPDRLVIIDSPPPRLAAESGALARQVDGILLVVKYASTSRKMVTGLIDQLGPNKVLGAIVNNFEIMSPYYAKEYYGYYGKPYKQK